MNIKKLIAVCCILFLLTAALPLAVSALPAKPAEGGVYDGEAVLSAATTGRIAEVNTSLAGMNGATLFVVTMPELEGSAADTARALFDAWELPRGAALLLVSDTLRDYYMYVGAGLADELDADSVRSLLAASLEPGFAAGETDTAVLSAVNTILAKISVADISSGGSSAGTVLLWVFAILLGLAVAGIMLFLLLSRRSSARNKRRRAARRRLPPPRPENARYAQPRPARRIIDNLYVDNPDPIKPKANNHNGRG